MRSFYKIFKQKYKKDKINNNVIVAGDIVTFKALKNFKHIGVVLRIEKVLKLDMADVFWSNSIIITCSAISLKRL